MWGGGWGGQRVVFGKESKGRLFLYFQGVNGVVWRRDELRVEKEGFSTSA